MSLLTMIQSATEDLGITSPSSVIGNTDAGVKQLLRIANREGKSLASNYDWQEMIRENSFTLVSGRNQGALNGTVITDSDYDYMISETLWNQTTDQPIVGPTNGRDWQVLQNFTITGPFERYRILDGNLLIDPAPSGGDTIQFEYMSTSWCESSGGTGQSAWAADTDVGKLNEDLMTLGIIWRWRQRKGLDYAEDLAEYERQVLNAQTRNKSAKTLSLNGRAFQRFPGAVVPEGSWNL